MEEQFIFRFISQEKSGKRKGYVVPIGADSSTVLTYIIKKIIFDFEAKLFEGSQFRLVEAYRNDFADGNNFSVFLLVEIWVTDRSEIDKTMYRKSDLEWLITKI